MLNMLDIIVTHNIHSLLVIQESDQRCTLACRFFFQRNEQQSCERLGTEDSFENSQQSLLIQRTQNRDAHAKLLATHAR